jgi:hypothetical protein
MRPSLSFASLDSVHDAVHRAPPPQPIASDENHHTPRLPRPFISRAQASEPPFRCHSPPSTSPHLPELILLAPALPLSLQKENAIAEVREEGGGCHRQQAFSCFLLYISVTPLLPSISRTLCLCLDRARADAIAYLCEEEHRRPQHRRKHTSLCMQPVPSQTTF